MAKEFTFKINGEPAKRTIAEIQAQIAALDEKIKTSDINNPDFSGLIEESKKAKSSLKILQEEGIDGLNPKGVMGNLKSLGRTLGEIPGPIGGIVQGFGGMTKAASAFIANPIGAVIAALGIIFTSLTKALKSTDAGMDALNKITAAFGAIVRPIVAVVEKLAVVLAEGLASALEVVGGLFGDTTSKMVEYTNALDDIEEAEQANEVARAKQNKELAASRELLSDTTASLKDRQAALDKVKASEIELADKEVANAKKKRDTLAAMNKLEADSEENRKRLRDAEIALANAEEATASKRRLFNKEQKKLDQEATKAAEDKAKEQAAAAKAYADARKAASDKIRQVEQKNLLDSIKDQTERDLKAAELEKENSKREIDRGNYTAKEKNKLKLAADEAYRLAKEKIDADAAQKEKDLQKELNDALINTDQEKFDEQQRLTTENYDKLIAKAKDNKDLQEKLEAQKLELLAQQKEEFDKSQKAKEDAKIKKEYDDKIKAINEAFEKQKNILILQGLTERQLKKETDKAELDALQAQLDATDKNSAEYLAIKAKMFQKEQQMRDDDYQHQIDVANKGLELATQAQGAIQAVGDAYYAGKLAKAEKGSKEEEDILRKQFEFNKKLQLSLAVIDGFKAVTSSLSQSPVAIGPVPNPVGIASLTFAIVTSAANIAKIAASKFEAPGGGAKTEAPKSAGSAYAEGGLLQGPSHDLGGIRTSLGELEGGEFVVNRRSTANFMPLLNQINAAGNTPGPEMTKGQDQPIIKTYVVASEMSSQQEADAKLSALARL
jgi:hypothetical protein